MFLRGHHTWNILEIPRHLRRQAMTWQCLKCQKYHNDQLEYCWQCNAHWTQATLAKPWKSRKGRSKSRRQKKGEGAVKADPIQKEEKEDLSLFAENVPWIASTPTGRLAKTAEKKDLDQDLPPQPSLPPPPTYSTAKEGLTEDEVKVLKSLQDLKALGEELTDKQREKMQLLEQKQRSSGQVKQLTHGHLHRVDRAKTRAGAVFKKIINLDTEWQKFVLGVTTKVQTHARLYQQSRQELIQAHGQRLQELRQMKAEAQQATSSMVEQQEDAQMPPEMPPVEEQLARIFTTVDAATAEAKVDEIVITDDEMEPELIEDDVAKPGAAKGAVKKVFQGARSPTRVANQHLKIKVEGEVTDLLSHEKKLPDPNRSMPFFQDCSRVEASSSCGELPNNHGFQLGHTVEGFQDADVVSHNTFQFNAPRAFDSEDDDATLYSTLELLQNSHSDISDFLAAEFGWNCAPRTVRFAEQIEVTVFGHHESFMTVLPLDEACGVLRQCWGHETEEMSYDFTKAVLSQTMQDTAFPSHPGEGRIAQVTATRNADAVENDQFMKIETRALIETLVARNKVDRIETWYLCKDRFEQCKFSRDVSARPGDDSGSFIARCLQASWEDVLIPGPIEWSFVRDAPNGRPMTEAHLILSQGFSDEHSSRLVHWDLWPILNKVRAQTLYRGDAVRSFFQRAQLRMPRSFVQAHPALHVAVDPAPRHFDADEVFWVDSSAVLYCYVLHVPESDSSSSDGEAGSSRSTTAGPESASLDAEQEDDVVSWTMTGNPIAFFDQFGPLPWEGPDPGHDVPEEDVEAGQIELAESQWDEVAQHQVLLVQEDPNQEFQLVAYGLGLISLGKRQATVRSPSLDVLLTVISDLWNDRAQFAPLKAIYVKPQPPSADHASQITFIVEVQYLEDGNPHRRCPVLIHELGDDTFVSDTSIYPAWIDWRANQPSLLHSIDRGQEIHPNGVRHARVTCDGRVLMLDQFSQISEGSLCTVQVDPVPAYVNRAIGQVEQAHLMFTELHVAADLHDIPIVECHFHGISPKNQALGSRVLHLPWAAFHQGMWFHEARYLWPFRSSDATIIYTKMEDVSPARTDERRFVFHFILCFCPCMHAHLRAILISQAIYAVEDHTSFHEKWAICVKPDVEPHNIVRHLHHHKFWTSFPERTHVHPQNAMPRVYHGAYIELVSYTHTHTGKPMCWPSSQMTITKELTILNQKPCPCCRLWQNRTQLSERAMLSLKSAEPLFMKSFQA